MSIKWIGAVLIILGCGAFGFSLASAHRREERDLQQLLSALDFMQCELQYRLTPLPELCRQAAISCKGSVRGLFMALSEELEDQVSPDVWHCMNAALARTPDLTSRAAAVAGDMGKTLGRFDLEGQLRGLENARKESRLALEKLTENRDVRLRSYHTLGLCAGAALAILFL